MRQSKDKLLDCNREKRYIHSYPLRSLLTLGPSFLCRPSPCSHCLSVSLSCSLYPLSHTHVSPLLSSSLSAIRSALSDAIQGRCSLSVCAADSLSLLCTALSRVVPHTNPASAVCQLLVVNCDILPSLLLSSSSTLSLSVLRLLVIVIVHLLR